MLARAIAASAASASGDGSPGASASTSGSTGNAKAGRAGHAAARAEQSAAPTRRPPSAQAPRRKRPISETNGALRGGQHRPTAQGSGVSSGGVPRMPMLWRMPASTALSAELEEADEANEGEQCVIFGCRRQLVRCYGEKKAGSAVGCGEAGHVLCMPCLERWFKKKNELRHKHALGALRRRCCPVCQVELRTTSSAMRKDAERYVLGLEKLDWSWS